MIIDRRVVVMRIDVEKGRSPIEFSIGTVRIYDLTHDKHGMMDQDGVIREGANRNCIIAGMVDPLLIRFIEQECYCDSDFQGISPFGIT